MTVHLKVDPQAPDLEAVEKVAEILRGGGVVVFPTETVYGIAVQEDDPEAERRLIDVKGRPGDKPFARLLPSAEDAVRLAADVGPRVRALMDRYWPGPLTLVLPTREDSESAPSKSSSPTTIGVRVPGSPFALALLHELGKPLLAPSANPSGEEPATTYEQAKKYFDGRVDAIVDGGEVTIKQSSTVVRIDEDRYEVLRSGIITPEMIHQLFSGRVVLFVCTGNTCRSPMAEALFRKLLAQKIGKAVDDLEESGYRILSAGTFAGVGSPPSDHSAQVMKERGCDLSNHYSRQLTPDLLAQADRVYAMTESHAEVAMRLRDESSSSASSSGTATPTIELLTERGISDPIGSDLDGYRRCADEIEKALEKILESL